MKLVFSTKMNLHSLVTRHVCFKEISKLRVYLIGTNSMIGRLGRLGIHICFS